MALIEGTTTTGIRYSPHRASEQEEERKRRERERQEREARKGVPFPPPAPVPRQSGALGEFEAALLPPHEFPDPTLMLRMIDRAYLSLHGTHPSAQLAARLLVSLPIGRSVDDYVALLEPGLSFGESPVAPTAPDGSEAVKIAGGRRPWLQIHAIAGDVPDMTEGQRSSRPLAWGEGDKPYANHTPTDEIDPYIAVGTINSMRLLMRESRDTDISLYEQREHDMLMRDWRLFEEIYGQRLAADGEPVDVDPDSGAITKNGIVLYARYVFDRLYADFMLGDDAQSAKALDAMEKVAESALGDRAAEIMASIKQQHAAYKESGVPDAVLLEDVYRSFVRGRGLNQSEMQARWDYIARFGRDYLPPEAAAQAAEDSVTLADALDETAGALFRAAGKVLGRTVTVTGEYLNPVDWLLEAGAEHAPGRIGEIAATLESWNDDLWGKAASATEYVASGEIFADVIPFVSRGVITLGSVAHAAGVFNLEAMRGEGEWAGMDASDLDDHFFRTITAVSEWKRAWDSGEGRQIVEYAAGQICDDFGLSRDNQAISFLVAVGDLYVAVRMGMKLDVGVRRVAYATPKVTLAAARMAYRSPAAIRAGTAGIGQAYRGSRLGRQEGILDLGSARITKIRGKLSPAQRKKFDALYEDAMRIIEANEIATYDAAALGARLRGDAGKVGQRGKTVRKSTLTGEGLDLISERKDTAKVGLPGRAKGTQAAAERAGHGGTREGKARLAEIEAELAAVDRLTPEEMIKRAQFLKHELPAGRNWAKITEPFSEADAADIPNVRVLRNAIRRDLEKERQWLRDTDPAIGHERLRADLDELNALVEQVEGAPPAVARIGAIEELADGSRVREVTLGARSFKTDASIAGAVARINERFAPTKGSHSAYPDDHGPGSAAMKADAPSYVEFEVRVLRRRKGALKAVRELDAGVGLRVVEKDGLLRVEGKTKGDIDYIADVLTGERPLYREVGPPRKTDEEYAEELIDEFIADERRMEERRLSKEPYAGPERRVGKPPPAEPPVAAGVPPEGAGVVPYRRYPKILQTFLEAIAEHMPEKTPDGRGTEAAIAMTLNIPFVKELRPALTELGRARTPQQVANIMQKYDLEFDPSMPGVFRTMRFNQMVSGSHAQMVAKMRIFGTFVALSDKMPLEDAPRHILHLGRALKMGRRKYDAEVQRRVGYWAQKMWEAGDDPNAMQRVLGRLDRDGVPEKGSFYREVYDNMGKSEWEKFLTMRSRLLRWRGRQWLTTGHRRGYGLDDDVVPAAYRRQIAAERRRLLKAASETEDPATVAQLRRDLDDVQRQIEMYDEAARVVSAQKSSAKMTLREAENHMESLAHPEPLAGFQLRKHLQHPVDPRMLSWFMAGDRSAKAIRAAMYAENVTLRPATQVFKLIALGTMGFPFRVLAGDEFVRLIPEGVGVGYGSRLGMKSYREAKATVTAMRRDGRLLKVSPELYEKMHSDWLREYSDDFRVVAPQELGTVPRGWVAMRDFMAKLRREPILEEWMKLGEKRPRTAAEVRQFVVDLIARDDPTGAAIRDMLVNTQRVTTRQGDLKVLRRLLAHPETRIGAAGNVNRFVGSWTDILSKIGNDEKLYQVFSKRDFSQKTIERISPDSLWAIPVKESWSSKAGGAYNPANWVSKWYEGIPTGRMGKVRGKKILPEEIGVMPLLAHLTNHIREAFFGHAYNREMARLRAKDPDIDPAAAHDIAATKAMAYVNRVTYVRNATVFEDLVRNVVPFINSYRQFALYWAQTFGKHPFAMSAFYQYNPLKGEMAQQLGDYQVFLPPVPFWTPQSEEEESLTGFMRNAAPNVNPFIAMGVGALLRGPLGVESDIEQVPGLQSTGRGWAPFGRLSRVPASMGVFLGPFGVEEDKVRREHFEIIRAVGKAPDGPLGIDDEIEVEYDWPLDWAYKLGMPYPEQAFQFIASTFTPVAHKYNPARKAMVGELRRNLRSMTPLQLAAYRAANEEADQLLSVWEEKDPEMRNRLIARWPWTEPYAISTYDRSQDDGTWTPNIADHIAKVAEGRIKLLADDAEFFRAWERKHVSIFGGWQRNKSTGAMEYTPPAADAEAALALYNEQMKKAKSWAKSTALRLAKGNAELAKQLYERWEKGVEDGDAGLRMPSFFEAQAVREGKNPADYNPIQLTAEFEADYGGVDREQSHAMSETTKKAVATLIESGLMGPGFRIAFESVSAFAPDIRKAREDIAVERLRALLSPAAASFYELDGRQIAKMQGLPEKHIPGLDAALIDVGGYYYNTYVPARERYGAQSREGRDAKLAFDRYRDRRFASVAGGKYLVGGLPERILGIRYFNHPRLPTVATGRNAPRQEQLWNEFWDEAMKDEPDPVKLGRYYAGFGKTNRSNWREVLRVSHHVYVAGMARYYRAIMKESYSEYYRGPGNSVYTSMGKQMVANLYQIIREAIQLDGGRKTSLFYRDIVTYFDRPDTYARNLLEWSYH